MGDQILRPRWLHRRITHWSVKMTDSPDSGKPSCGRATRLVTRQTVGAAVFAGGLIISGASLLQPVEQSAPVSLTAGTSGASSSGTSGASSSGTSGASSGGGSGASSGGTSGASSSGTSGASSSGTSGASSSGTSGASSSGTSGASSSGTSGASSSGT